MKLYKLSFNGVTSFIVAPCQLNAKMKFALIHKFPHVHTLDVFDCDFICFRDQIIPTVEPSKEF